MVCKRTDAPRQLFTCLIILECRGMDFAYGRRLKRISQLLCVAKMHVMMFRR